MREAAAHLIGEHDFSAFRSSECQAQFAGARSAAARGARERRLCRVRSGGQCVPASHGAQHRRLPCLRRQRHVRAGVDGARCWPAATARPAAPTFDAAGLYLAHVSYDAVWGLPQPARRAWFDGNLTATMATASQDLRHHAPRRCARGRPPAARTPSASCSAPGARATSSIAAAQEVAARAAAFCHDGRACSWTPRRAKVEAVLERGAASICCSFTATKRPSSARDSACRSSRLRGSGRGSICYNTRADYGEARGVVARCVRGRHAWRHRHRVRLEPDTARACTCRSSCPAGSSRQCRRRDPPRSAVGGRCQLRASRRAPGIKDPQKIAAFIKEVRSADV